MSTHISDGALIAALKGYLPRGELLSMKEHIGRCPSCERRMWSAVRDLLELTPDSHEIKIDGRADSTAVDLAFCA
jgi:hypothetical protein